MNLGEKYKAVYCVATFLWLKLFNKKFKNMIKFERYCWSTKVKSLKGFFLFCLCFLSSIDIYEKQANKNKFTVINICKMQAGEKN